MIKFALAISRIEDGKQRIASEQNNPVISLSTSVNPKTVRKCDTIRSKLRTFHITSD